MRNILNKQVLNTAMVILFTLGATACSVNSGKGDLGTPVTLTNSESAASSNTASSNSSTTDNNTATNNTSTTSDEQKKAEEANNTAEADATKATEEATAKAAEEATAKAAAEKAAIGAKTARINQYTNTYFANQTDSYAYKRISDEAEYTKLVAEAKAAPVLSGNCLNNASSGCRGQGDGAAEAGKVMKAYQASYSGYATLRETYADTNADAGIPNNAYFYYVDTPTTDKSKVVDATYTGQVSYSKGNVPAINGSGASGIDALTMTVKGDTISGKVTKTYGSANKTTIDMITFNQGAISVATDGTVGFSGTTEFNGQKNAFNTKGEKNFTGTYKGQFAGEDAKEIVGTFESDSTAKDVSVQGAFSATK